MLTTGLVAIDSTIVATAVPSIVHEIGGFSSFPWLFSAYMLAQAVSVPVYAKLSDMLGRKPLILAGIGLFLLGSILCGVAVRMPALIAFRALQGLGAGAVQPMAITIAGDIYSLTERAKVQGYLASVWAISSVVGPTLGGVFASLGIWRGIFLINIPLCLLAAWMLMRTFHENVERSRHRIDYLGSGLLTGSMTLIILGALEGGQAWAWNSPTGFAVFGIGALLFVLFVLAERRAAEPVLPLWVVSRRLLLTTTLISFGVGAIILGLTSYVPTFLEGSLNVSPVLAGLALAALTIGWPISASQSGRLYLRIGFRRTALIGIVISVQASLRSRPLRRTSRSSRRAVSSSASGWDLWRPRRSSRRNRASNGTSAAWSRGPICSPGRWEARSGSRSSARWPTPSTPARPAVEPIRTPSCPPPRPSSWRY
jgi:MFS family permease